MFIKCLLILLKKQLKKDIFSSTFYDDLSFRQSKKICWVMSALVNQSYAFSLN